MEPEQSDDDNRGWHNSQRPLFSSFRGVWVCFSLLEQMDGRQFFRNLTLVLLRHFLVVIVSVHDFSPFMKILKSIIVLISVRIFAQGYLFSVVQTSHLS